MSQEISFGKLVREHRLALGLTQVELSVRVGCAAITVRKIEADALRPSTQIAGLLAVCLKIPEAETENFIHLARTSLLSTPSPSPVPKPPPLPEELGKADLSGRAIRGYALGKRIGAGSYGAVYQARQAALNRDVAVKVILPVYANSPDFIRHFEAEAQTVARLEHPHIVPLYDFWREPGAAYLIMRLLPGGSLKDRLANKALTTNELHLLLAQLCPALHVAHCAGVIHRDIKPSNILLDLDGNYFLADFGIARQVSQGVEEAEDSARPSISPYTPPEQNRAEYITPRTDIFALGSLVCDALTGKLPVEGGLADLTPEVAKIVEKATHQNPASRHANALHLLAECRRALTNQAEIPVEIVPADTPDFAAIENPYKGLQAFQETDAANFFGREMLIQELLGRLAEPGDLSRFMAVVGPSGCGKSSLVKAGLVPALRRGGLPGSENWFVTDFLPGDEPMVELATALMRVAVDPPDDLLARLQKNERGLLRTAVQIMPEPDDVELVLVIDQFEELFTLTTSEAKRSQFLASLVTAVLEPDSCLRLIITMRADFTGQLLRYMDFGELMRHRTEFVIPPSPDELEAIITQPARRAGLVPEPGLVQQIIGDVGQQPGALPLLQYALTELVEAREGNQMTLAAYQQTGGVLGALGHRAEKIYAEMLPPAQQVAKQMFLRLVTLGEGVEDTRRRVLRAELASLAGAGDVGEENTPLAAYGRYRLLTFDCDPVTREPTVEVAHEALLREWPRLQGWLNESRTDLRLRQILTAATHEWRRAGQDSGYLLRGSRLDQFAGWAAQAALALSDEEATFLAASLQERQDRAAAEAARTAREQAMERQQARLTQEAYSRVLAAHARQAMNALQNDTALALAMAAVAINDPPAEAVKALKQAAFSPGARREFALPDGLPALALAVTPDGRNAFIGMGKGRTALLDLASGDILHTGHGHSQNVTSVAISPDGQWVVSGGRDAEIILWELVTGREQKRFQTHTGCVYGLDFHPDGRHFVSCGFAEGDPWIPGELFLWHVEGDRPVRQFAEGHKYGIRAAAFSPDGRTLLSNEFSLGGAGAAYGSPLILWQVDSGDVIHRFPAPNDIAFCVAFAPDGRTALSTTINRIYRWDVVTGEQIRLIEGHDLVIAGMAVSPDGRTFLTCDNKNRLTQWETETGMPMLHLTHPRIMAIAFCPDGRTALSVSEDGTLIAWDLHHASEVRRFAGHEGGISDVNFSPDGTRLLTAGGSDFRFNIPGEDFTVRLWQVATGEQEQRLTGHTGIVSSAQFSPDGRRAITTSMDGSMRLWDLATGVELRRFTYHELFWQVAFHPNCRWVFTGTKEPSLLMWDVETGDLLRRFLGHADGVWTVAVSPDGERVLTGSGDGTMILWDVASGEPVRRFWDVSQGAVHSVSYSPDGRLAAAGYASGKVVVWQIQSGEKVSEFDEHHGILDLNMLHIGADSRTAVSASWDGVIWVWDLLTGEAKHRFAGRPNIPIYPALSPDGRTIVSGGQDFLLILWQLDELPLDELREWIAANRFVRDLTRMEQSQYGIDHVPTGSTPDMAASIPVAANPSQHARLGRNQGNLEPGKFDVWLYAGAAGEVLTLRLIAERPANGATLAERAELGLLDTLLFLIGPDGRLLGMNDDGGRATTNSLLANITLPVDGTYRIEARSWHDQSAGNYTLVIEKAD